MLFKKIAIAAAVATTLAFVGCAKKEEAPAAAAASEVAAASEAVQAASEVAVDAAAAASEVNLPPLPDFSDFSGIWSRTLHDTCPK